MLARAVTFDYPEENKRKISIRITYQIHGALSHCWELHGCVRPFAGNGHHRRRCPWLSPCRTPTIEANGERERGRVGRHSVIPRRCAAPRHRCTTSYSRRRCAVPGTRKERGRGSGAASGKRTRGGGEAQLVGPGEGQRKRRRGSGRGGKAASGGVKGMGK